eukprot:627573-Pleurochrysis_carterae.AAC.2
MSPLYQILVYLNNNYRGYSDKQANLNLTDIIGATLIPGRHFLALFSLLTQLSLRQLSVIGHRKLALRITVSPIGHVDDPQSRPRPYQTL